MIGGWGLGSCKDSNDKQVGIHKINKRKWSPGRLIFAIWDCFILFSVGLVFNYASSSFCKSVVVSRECQRVIVVFSDEGSLCKHRSFSYMTYSMMKSSTTRNYGSWCRICYNIYVTSPYTSGPFFSPVCCHNKLQKILNTVCPVNAVLCSINYSIFVSLFIYNNISVNLHEVWINSVFITYITFNFLYYICCYLNLKLYIYKIVLYALRKSPEPGLVFKKLIFSGPS